MYLLPLACAVLLTGCNKEPEQNWYHNTYLVFYVEDDRGNNLLDIDYGDNMLRDGISIVYKGETYSLQNIPTRAEGYVPPEFDGLELWMSWSTEVPVRMAFGQFGIVSDTSLGVKEYRGEKLTINWGGEDKLTSEIEFDLYATVDKGKETIHQAIRVTGGVGVGAKSDNSLNLTIVK